MVQGVSPLSSLEIPVALVPVQMTMANRSVLESSIVVRTYDHETLLCGLLSLELVLFDLSFGE